MQLVPVDEPSGGDVADDGVVLPAVPEPADHLDGVGGLVEQVRRRGCRGVPNSSASCGVPLTRTCQPARPCETKSSVAMAFETWNGSVWVTVATGIRPMWFVTGATREATSTASGRPASQRGSISGRRRRCGGERVVEGHEVQQSAFGGGGQAGPVPATRHGLEVRRVPPCLRVPAVAVERDREVQMLGHGSVFCERDRIDLALGGQRLGQPRVSRRQVQRLGLGLAVAGRQIDAPVAAGGDLGLQLDEQRLGVARGAGAGCRSRCA